MELVYLWVEDYKNIKKQGFNFSPRFKCQYDDESENLTIDKNDDYVDIFPDNINITAIVGENGSGKSNLIYIIRQILFYNASTELRFVLIVNIDKALQLMTNINTLKSSFTHRNKFNLDYYLYLASEQNGNVTEDLSLYIGKRKEEKRIWKYNMFSLNNAVIGEMLTDKYIRNDNFNLTSFMYIPHKIVINRIDFKSILHNVCSPSLGLFDSVLVDPRSISEDDKVYYNLQKLFDKITDNYHKFLIILHVQHYNSENYSEFSKKSILIDKLIENKDFLSEIEFNNYFKEEERFIDSFTDKERDVFFYKYKEFFQFDFTDSINRKFSHLSHGEQTIFGQMLNIYYLSKKTENTNLILLLDEPDLSLHPEWQRKYLKELDSLLETESTNYNVVLTSHSPFLLSDIPKKNVIFLKDGKQIDALEKKQTFGANIHTLLSDGFFMEGGLMGEFAKGKIDEVIELLNSQGKIEDKELKLCKDVVSIIGEPILKKQLQRMLNNKLELSNKDEIDIIKEQMKELTNRLSEIENDSN